MVFTTISTINDTTSTWMKNLSLITDVAQTRKEGDCIVLPVNSTLLWENPLDPIDAKTEVLIDQLKSGLFIPVLFLIGFPVNILNLMVFYKQGLRERVILCLFCLAFSDIIYITVLFLLYVERVYMQFTSSERFTTVYQFAINKNAMGMYGFIYVSMFLNALIASERCFCVLFPLKAKNILKTRSTAVIIFVAGSIIAFSRFVVTAQYKMECFLDASTGQKSLQIYVSDFYFKYKHIASNVDSIFYGFCLTIGCPIIVFITTTITTLRLMQTIAWRRQTTSDMSSKEIALTKMLICLSLEFFILSIPYIVMRVAPLFEARLGTGSSYLNFRNTKYALLSLTEISGSVSLTVNFFVYYFTGTRFRETLHEIMRGGKRKMHAKGTQKNGSAAQSSYDSNSETSVTTVVG